MISFLGLIHRRLLFNQAVGFHQKGNLAEAERLYEKIVAADPLSFEPRHLLGVLRHQQGRTAEALEFIEAALKINPNAAEALSSYGLVLSALGRFGEALSSYDKALALNPSFLIAWNNRGNALSGLKRFKEALVSFEKALAVKPDHAEALNNRGNALLRLERFEEALVSLDKALAIKPNIAEAQYNRGTALLGLKHFEEALASLDKALAMKADYPQALNNRGTVLGILGKHDEARAAYLKAMAFDPSLTPVYFNYAHLVKFSADAPQLKTMEAIRDGSDPLSDTDRIQLEFALAKAYADSGDHARSFRRLLSGNALKRAQTNYDEDNVLAKFDRIETMITAELLRKMEKLGGGDPSSKPIFILGVARSGSSLVEQILASHPKVHGAGELTTLCDVVSNVRGPSGNPIPYPEFVTGLDAHALCQIGANYLAQIKKVAPTATHITDKMPSNFILAGLIHLALPKAYIIHTVRDPLDTCISCFSKLFTGEQNHTYDLVELGRYFRRYQKLMQHWQRVLPQGRILNVHYEDVVSDLEGQARRMIAHCGLEWEERCLLFNATDRPVLTASSFQVRQPIYQSAVGRARAYEEFLGPLKEALGSA